MNASLPPGSSRGDEPTPNQLALIERLLFSDEPPPKRGVRHLHLTFPSVFVHGDDAITLVVERMHSWHWVTKDQADLLTHALHEAVGNAVMHGNRGQLGTTVDLELWADGQHWDLHVSDQGKGFTLREALRAFRGRRRNLGNGRGLLIMAGSVEHLAFYRGGRTAVLGGYRMDALRQG